ncbi:MAG: putative teichuronic acid biosynthesis glycosyltransferase TuaC [candidate division BRC1 bacterium ADurb.BinA364]|nr:MAG: putative teichuronic acid biosynthesis glycosyltransferase TuaC [candidate division BRC1 bacterium ADurb.BinA364]
MRMLYVLSRYPKVSETFVYREIAFLRDLGHTIRVFSILPVDPAEKPLLAANLLDPADRIQAPPLWRLALEAIWRSPVPRGQKSAARAPWRERLTDRLAMTALARRVAREAARFEADWIHAHFATIASTAAWGASALSGIPFGFTIHNIGLFSRVNPFLGGRLRDAALPVTISEYNRLRIAERFGRKIAERVAVVHCGVDLAEFAFQREGRDLDVVSVGRLVDYKGMDILLEALSRIPDMVAHCEIVGDGPERPLLERMIALRDLKKRVLLRGERPESETRLAVERARVFVLASRIGLGGARDGIPVALMEAMASGAPCVSCRVAGVPELIEDGKSGLLAAPGDPETLAQAMRKMLGDEDLQEMIAREARAKVERDFDARKNVADLARRIEAAAKK